MISRRKLSLLIVVAMTPISTMAFAEEENILDELVVTGTRSESSIMDLAGNTAKVDEQDIDLLNSTHIQETLLRVPGVNLQRGNGAEMTIALRSPVLTGPGAGGSFLWLEDNIALRYAAFANNNGLSEANFEQAGSIEVVRGPGSALYGSNAVHGLVNVLSRAPTTDFQSSIDFTSGIDEDVYQLKGTVSDTVGNHGYRASINGIKENGWRDDSGMDQQKFTGRHDYFSPNGTDAFKTILSLYNLNQETAGFIKSEDDRELYKDEDIAKSNPSENAYRDWQSLRLSSRWDHEMSNGNLLSITPYFRTNEMEFRQHYLPSEAIEKNEHDSLGVQTAYYMDLQGGHNVIFGLDAEYTEGSLKETQEKDTFFSFGKVRQKGEHYNYDVDATVLSPFVHAEWQLAQKLRATTGLRYDYTKYKYTNNLSDGNGCMTDDGKEIPGGCLYQRPADRDDSFSNLSPKLGLVYRLAEAHSLYGNLTRGFRAPQTTDLYRIQKKQVVGELDSEQADSLEIGIRGAVFQNVNYELLGYYMKKKNFFFRDSFGNNVTDGKTKHRGVEASLFMPLTQQFDVGANYTYAIHQYDFDQAAKFGNDTITSGDDIDTAPRNIANVRFGWNYLANSRAEIEWSHIGEYFLDPANNHTYDGHDVFNLRTDWYVTSNVMVRGQILNLTDVGYADRADFAFGDYRFFPGQGRNYHVGVSYNF